MKDQFVDYETAKILKELGFDIPCAFMYDEQFKDKEKDIALVDFDDVTDPEELYNNFSSKQISCPLWQQVEEWLWEKHTLRIEIYEESYLNFEGRVKNGQGKHLRRTHYFYSPIDAKIDAIKQAVKYLKEK